jgi:phosphotransferase system  glucose/maltose/N-acetylglucosamine-specific IIC component
VSLDEQLPPPPGPPAYPVAPPQPQRTSGIAITGFILAFILPLIGFILSLIAVFKTGAGKAKGRGLAIAGVIISLLIMAGIVVVVVFASQSTVADPGCTAGKQAIIDGSKNVTPATLKTTIDGLNAAAAKAKHDDVRNAMKALADDYSKLLTGMTTGTIPPGTEDKANADVDKIDSLCTIGS